MTPRQATSDAKKFKLPSHTYETKTAWIALNGSQVSLYKQRVGEAATEYIHLSRRDFHALIDWYQRD